MTNLKLKIAERKEIIARLVRQDNRQLAEVYRQELRDLEKQLKREEAK